MTTQQQIAPADFVQTMEIALKQQINAICKLVNLSESDENHVFAVAQIYALLKNYTLPEIVISIIKSIFEKFKEPCESVVVINKGFMLAKKNNELLLLSLETGGPVDADTITQIYEQHGVDLTACINLWKNQYKNFIEINQKASSTGQ